MAPTSHAFPIDAVLVCFCIAWSAGLRMPSWRLLPSAGGFAETQHPCEGSARPRKAFHRAAGRPAIVALLDEFCCSLRHLALIEDVLIWIESSPDPARCLRFTIEQ
ncbi:hypothetical protein PR003_g7853 [Phytophthora rubi]|uniref:Uncharacterized protein n=1 Tax=Phytophthora rubi TaxID=129364 RepID=A0A6A4FKQ5_9STRA|nr:hypothetical protein PR003_g7853 [Phytophthora rubi]